MFFTRVRESSPGALWLLSPLVEAWGRGGGARPDTEVRRELGALLVCSETEVGLAEREEEESEIISLMWMLLRCAMAEDLIGVLLPVPARGVAAGDGAACTTENL